VYRKLSVHLILVNNVNVRALSDFRNKDREIEEAEEKHQMEIKVYKQKVKHLLYEHQNNLSELKVPIINFRFQLNAQYFISVTMLLYMFRALLRFQPHGHQTETNIEPDVVNMQRSS